MRLAVKTIIKKPRRALYHAEEIDCIRLKNWADRTYFEHEGKRLAIGEILFHIPNGGNRNLLEAKRLKAQGTKKGVSDYHLPVPKNGKHGAWAELKQLKRPAPVSKEQKAWIELMRKLGHDAEVYRGWKDAAKGLCNYLGIEFKE